MRSQRAFIVVAAALVLAFGSFRANADGVDESILELKALAQKTDDAKTIAAIRQLADIPDPRVTKLLVDLTDSDRADVACAAYQAAAPRKDPTFLEKLKTRAGDKKLAIASPKAYQAVLESLAVYADRSSLDVLEEALPRYLGSNAEFSTRIVRAYATVREKRVVDRMVKWLLSSESGTAMSATTKPSPSASKEVQANYAKCHDEILKQLTALTALTFKDYKEWKAWWKDAEASFKFPPPPAAPPAAPPAPK